MVFVAQIPARVVRWASVAPSRETGSVCRRYMGQITQAGSDMRGVPRQAATNSLPDFQTYPQDARYDNAVSVTGNLGSDPQMTEFSSGNCVVRFPLALKRKMANDDQVTEWIDVEAWSVLGQRAHVHFRKGAWVGVHGRLKVDKWTDKTTQVPRKKISVEATEFYRITADMPEGQSIDGQAAGLSKEALWGEYAANPGAFWDNRQSKLNPKGPDFVHKVTRAALWLDSAPPGIVLEDAPY